MESTDLELGPIQDTFDKLFQRISQYFQSAPVVPVGAITETDLSGYSQEKLRKTLDATLNHYGFSDLPVSMRVAVSEASRISCIHRSDNIVAYGESMQDRSQRTFNFYSSFGPENMKASFYWFDMKKGGEETHGILTKDDKWYMRIATTLGDIFYLRMDKAKHY